MLNRIGGKSRERGMSLIEIIIIIVMIGVVALPLTQLAKVNLRGLASYITTTMAQYDTQSIIEQIHGDYLANGYTATVTTWSGRSGSTNTGFTYSVTMSGEAVLNGVTYRTVTVTVNGKRITNMTLNTWIPKN
jgi:Tfp pilus assembly protein PilE